MSENDSHSNTCVFCVKNFIKSRFKFIFYRYLGNFDIYMIDDWQCKEGYHLQKSQSKFKTITIKIQII